MCGECRTAAIVSPGSGQSLLAATDPAPPVYAAGRHEVYVLTQYSEKAVGKGKRNRAARQAAAHRRLVVADALEIGERHGIVTLRAGRPAPGTAPTCAAMHAQLFAALLPALHSAALDAEEAYWELTIPKVRELGENPDPATTAAHIEKWLLAEDWHGALRAMPATGPGEPFMIILAGHVGLALEQPYTPSRVLIILDPVQLHRVDDSLRSALAAAMAAPAAAPWALAEHIADAHRFLARQPWPSNAPLPTRAEVEASTMKRREAFLSREPFIRPEENNLYPVMGGDDMAPGNGEAEEPRADQCERCEVARQIGGIVCVCGHDWGCHSGTPPQAEPCTHCPCQNMRTPDQL